MALIFNVSQGIPSPPANFPTCKDFSVDKDTFDTMLEKNKLCAVDGNCHEKPPTSAGILVSHVRKLYLYMEGKKIKMTYGKL